MELSILNTKALLFSVHVRLSADCQFITATLALCLGKQIYQRPGTCMCRVGVARRASYLSCQDVTGEGKSHRAGVWPDKDCDRCADDEKEKMRHELEAC